MGVSMVRQSVAAARSPASAIEPAREEVGSAIPDASRCRFCPDGANQFDPFAPIHLADPLLKGAKSPKANFVSGFKLIGISSPGLEIFLSENRKLWYVSAVLFHWRGVAQRHQRGMGWDAVDAWCRKTSDA